MYYEHITHYLRIPLFLNIRDTQCSGTVDGDIGQTQIFIFQQMLRISKNQVCIHYDEHDMQCWYTL